MSYSTLSLHADHAATTGLVHRWLGEETRKAELRMWGRLLRLSLMFTVPVWLLAMVLPHISFLRPLLEAMLLGFPVKELAKWALTTPVQFWIGARFHIGAYKALRNGRCCFLAGHSFGIHSKALPYGMKAFCFLLCHAWRA